jgi:hypothetical protein
MSVERNEYIWLYLLIEVNEDEYLVVCSERKKLAIH